MYNSNQYNEEEYNAASALALVCDLEDSFGLDEDLVSPKSLEESLGLADVIYFIGQDQGTGGTSPGLSKRLIDSLSLSEILKARDFFKTITTILKINTWLTNDRKPRHRLW